MNNEKRVLLTANYSVIEPLFALHLGGLLKDKKVPWTFFPVKKYDYDSLLKRIDQFGATDVGFNAYSGNHTQVYRIADKLRKNGFTVHIGGPHATYFAKESAEHADWVYKGQSFDSFGAYIDEKLDAFVKESLLLELTEKYYKDTINNQISKRLPVSNDFREEALKQVEEKVFESSHGREFIDEVNNRLLSRILFRQKLSPTFPKPDRVTFYADNPDMRDNPIKNSICGEGCPYSCTYCYNVAWNSEEMYGKFKRRVLRPINDVMEELSELKEYGTKLIYFQDDVFGFELEWMRKFMPEYKSRVGIPFHAQLRLELTNDSAGIERLKLMKQAGCTGVTVAIENGNYKVRRDILHRAMTAKQIFFGCKNISNEGLTLRTEQILGTPGPDTKPGGSSIDYDLQTLLINNIVRPTISWTSILAPYGGTELGKKCVELGLYDENKLNTNNDVDDSFFESSVLNYSPLCKLQLKTLQRLFSTFAHHEQGYDIARIFLTEKLPKYPTKTIEDFLVPAKDIAKVTKSVLYDNELYGIKNDKSRDELLVENKPIDGLNMSLDEEQFTVFNLMKPLWTSLPSARYIAEAFLGKFGSYTREQKEAFVTIISGINDVAKSITTNMDKEYMIQQIIDSERDKI